MVLGNGGTTALWDALAFGMVRERAHHLTYGEFSSKFAKVTAGAPFLADPVVTEAEPGDAPARGRRRRLRRGRLGPQRDLDRRDGAGHPPRRRRARAGGRHLGRRRACRSTPRTADVYYFAPQKSFAADGGLWLAAISPAALERVGEIAGSDRWIPEFLSLATALDNSRKEQTYNTPAVATLWLLAEQLDWMNEGGGLEGFCVARTRESSDHLYGWAEASEYATPFVADPAKRSLVVGTIDFSDAVDAAAVAAALRANGIVDTEPYRKLGPQPAADRHVPGGRARRRARAHRLHRLRGGERVMTRVLVAEDIGASGVELLR